MCVLPVFIHSHRVHCLHVPYFVLCLVISIFPNCYDSRGTDFPLQNHIDKLHMCAYMHMLLCPCLLIHLSMPIF